MGLRSLLVVFVGGGVWQAISIVGGMCSVIEKWYEFSCASCIVMNVSIMLFCVLVKNHQ